MFGYRRNVGGSDATNELLLVKIDAFRSVCILTKTNDLKFHQYKQCNCISSDQVLQMATLEKIYQKTLMARSSHIQSVLIGVEYRNCCRTLDVYLLSAIWIGQIQSTLIYILVTYDLASL